MKTTHWKSGLANLLQVSNLIFHPWVKVQLGHHIEKALLSPLLLLLFMVRLPPVFLNTGDKHSGSGLSIP